MDANFSVTDTYNSNPEFEKKFATLKSFVGNLHYQELPNFCTKLAKEAYCVEDPYGIWDVIEAKIEESLHLLEAVQLAQIIYAATFRAPKLLSLDLRKQMISLMLNDHAYLNTGDKAIVLASLTNSMNISRNRVFVKDFNDNFSTIVANSSGPADVLNYLAASTQSQLKNQYRVTRGVESTYALELSFYFDKFYDYLLDHFDEFTNTEKMRLFQAINMANVPNTYEIYVRIKQFKLLLTRLGLVRRIHPRKSQGNGQFRFGNFG